MDTYSCPFCLSESAVAQVNPTDSWLCQRCGAIFFSKSELTALIDQGESLPFQAKVADSLTVVASAEGVSIQSGYPSCCSCDAVMEQVAFDELSHFYSCFAHGVWIPASLVQHVSDLLTNRNAPPDYEEEDFDRLMAKEVRDEETPDVVDVSSAGEAVFHALIPKLLQIL